MPDIGTRPIHRVKGRPALARRLRGLLVAVHRYGRARATTETDRRWAAILIDRLTHALAAADTEATR